MINPLKEAIRNNTPTAGVSITINSSRVAAVLAHAKCDWIWIDLEHGLLGLECAYELVQATKGTPCVPLVRIPANQDWLVKQGLDLGVYGMIFPFVTSAEDVMRAVRSSTYPPRGMRGVSSGYHRYRWELEAIDYWRTCDDELVRIGQVENLEGIEHIEDIMAAGGLDLVFIGTSDLAAALECIGEPNHPKVEEQISKVLDAGKKLKVPLGIVATTPSEIDRRRRQGFSFFLAGSDAAMLTKGTLSTLNTVR